VSDFIQRHRAKSQASQSHNTDQSKQDMPLKKKLILQLIEHKAILKTFKATDAKISTKRDFLPLYIPYMQGIVEADTKVQDDLFVQVMIWIFDVQDYEALRVYLDYALKAGMSMPDGFKRSLLEFFAESLAEDIIKRNTLDAVAETDLFLIETTLSWIDTFDPEGKEIGDEPRAKVFKAAGLVFMARPDYHEAAVNAFETALKLDDSIGVKGLLNKAKKRLAVPSSNVAPVEGDD